MSFFLGDIRILYIKVDAIYKPIGCLTSNPFEEESDTLETTTRESDGWETFIPTKQRFSIPFEGLQVRDDDKLSYLELKQLKRDRERIEWKIEDGNQTFVDEGFGYITSIGESNSVGDFLSFSGLIKGYGKPLIITSDGDLWMNGQNILFQDGTPMIFN